MSFAEIQNTLEEIQKITILESVPFPFLAFDTLTSSSLETPVAPEALIVDGEIPITLSKRHSILKFSNPTYVKKIKLQVKGGVSTKRLTISYHGSNSNSSIFRKTFGPKELIEVDVNSVVAAIEINCSKAISECISRIEVIGYSSFEPDLFQANLEKAAQVTSSNEAKIREVISKAILEAQTGAQLEDELSKIEEEKTDLQTEIASLNEARKASETTIATLQNAEIGLRSAVKTLQEQHEVLKTTNAELDFSIASNRETARQTKVELSQIKNEKSFYNSTLGGYKQETKKNFWINIVLAIFLVILAIVIAIGAFCFYEEALKQIQLSEGDTKLWTITLLRLGASGVFLTAFYWTFESLQTVFSKTLNLITDTRNIEAKLILARDTAETVLKIDDEDDKRNYASFLSFVILKNHFMNMSFDSLGSDLQIEPAKLKRIIPSLPEKLGLLDLGKSLIEKATAKTEPQPK